MPASLLHAQDNQVGWKDDRLNVTRLDHFMDQSQKAKDPFMAFMFFESPHARYFFPQDAVIRPDYLKAFNYATVDVNKDVGLIKKRYINAPHALDQPLGRVLDHLKEKGLLDNSIVIGSWSALGYVGENYKISMPMNLAGMDYMNVTTAHDRPVADASKIVGEEKDKLANPLKDISRFYRK